VWRRNFQRLPGSRVYVGKLAVHRSESSDQSFLGGLRRVSAAEGQRGDGGRCLLRGVAGPKWWNPTVCNSGSASITGSTSGQNVTLDRRSRHPDLYFYWNAEFRWLELCGTYTSTAGTAADGTPCGTAQTGLQWSATSAPLLTGVIQGSFHSTLTNRDFPVTGVLVQGPNIGAAMRPSQAT